jgi:predicted RNA-binding Zn-ribbon protein involved in translation (DUF1610 family)
MMRDPGCVARCTLAGLPELGLFPDGRALHSALREYGTSMRGANDWRSWAVLSAMTILAAVVGFITGQVTYHALGFVATGAVNYWIRLLTMVLVFWALLRAAQRCGAALRLRQSLIELGVPVCAKCGYALIGHEPDAQRCPECGRAIDEQIAALLAMPPETALLDSSDQQHAHVRAA